MSLNDDRVPLVVGISVTFICLTAISMSLRFFTRIYILRVVGADDFMALVAAIAANALSAELIVATRYGLGRHIDQMEKSWVQPQEILQVVASFSYQISSTFIKISLLLFYLRLSQRAAFRTALYTVMGVTIAVGAVSIVLPAIQCIPLSKLWKPTEKGRCIDLESFYYANTVWNIVIDMTIYVLPMRTLWKLHMPKRQRLSLCLMIGLGGIVVIASICRSLELKQIFASPDYTWNVVHANVWSSIEVSLAVVVSCAPAFLAFIRHVCPSLFTGISTSRNKSKKSKSGDNESGAGLDWNPNNGGVSLTTTSSSAKRMPTIEEDSTGLDGHEAGRIHKQIDVSVFSDDA